MVRISGNAARAIADQILRIPQDFPWDSWTSTLAHLLDAKKADAEGSTVDHVVVTWFQGPRSYTAEDVVEIACHGSPVVLRHALARAVEAGARLAQPGEFTLRAYLNGRVDLPQAEAVRDLIDATTLYQARVAAQQVEGSVSRRIKPLKEKLLELIAMLEAGIDFAEDDVSVASGAEIIWRDWSRLRPAFKRSRRALRTGSWCTMALPWRSWGSRMSARAACSTGCWNRIARL